MTDLIRRDDALAACDIGPCSEWNDYTKDGYSLAADDCKRGIAALPTVDPATLTSKYVDNSKTANPVVNDHIADVGKMVDPAAIREAAMREVLALRRLGQTCFDNIEVMKDGWLIHEDDVKALIGKRND
jgi:hypothetical protein